MATEYILGVDYGEKRVGIALAHHIARLPRPFTVIPNDEQLVQKIQHLISDENVGLVVVGLPRGMDGGYTAQTHAAEHFAGKLKELLTIPVELADETLTSIDAEAAGAVKGNIDAVAAGLILERYLADHPAQRSTT